MSSRNTVSCLVSIAWIPQDSVKFGRNAFLMYSSENIRLLPGNVAAVESYQY